MARLSSRQARTRKLIQLYLRHHSLRLKRRIRLKDNTVRSLRHAGYTEDEQQLAGLLPLECVQLPLGYLILNADSDSESISSSMGSDSDDTDTSDSSSDGNWSDLLGSDWRGSGQSSEVSDDSESSVFSDSDSGDADDEMPDLLPLGYPDSDDEDDSSSDETSSTESGSKDPEDAVREWDRELVNAALGDHSESAVPRGNVLLRWVQQSVDEMHAQRYEMPRDTFPRGPAFMRHVLTDMKDTRPDLFREELRISPYTFDRLVAALSDDPVFTNNSPNGQIPIEDQLAVALFRFGHSGNAAGIQKVANWAGIGKGTVTLITRRVMTAVLRPGFMAEAVRKPTASEKESAKAWVEAHSCKGWRDGWQSLKGTEKAGVCTGRGRRHRKTSW
ncbi:hypothetical protein B0H11DRAFT_2270268 [Mycena galericulata]|nr:hypothetical protein B0H11DRAFT_2270268 [Mycena galericulata]